MSIVDLADLSETKRIDVGRMPYGVAINLKQHKVYVSNQLENSVSVILDVPVFIVRKIEKKQVN